MEKETDGLLNRLKKNIGNRRLGVDFHDCPLEV